MLSNIALEIDKARGKYPEAVALEMNKQNKQHRYTFVDLVEAGKKCGKILQAAGIPESSRVVLICESSPELFISLYALFSSGYTVVLLDPNLSKEETTSLIQQADPQGFIVSTLTAAKLDASFNALPAFVADKGYATREGFADRLSPALAKVKDGDSAIAFVLFTSGTTSTPKGVMLEHTAILHGIYGISEIMPIQPEQRTVQILPIFHIAPLTCALGLLFHGCGLHFLEKVEGPIIVATMAEVKPKQQLVVPRLLEFFQQRITEEVKKQGPLKEKAFFSLLEANAFCKKNLNLNMGPVLFKKIHTIFGGHVENMVCGGSALSKETFQFFENIGFKISEGYGLTETSGGVTMNAPEKRAPGSVGQLIKGVQIKIKKEGHSPEGEILIKSPSMMRGYFRDPERTAELIRDGWFHTGDLGRLDEHNNLFVTGRVKEMIMTSGGKKISPLTVESNYQDIPGLKELAVVGISKDDKNADTIVGFVVLEEDDARAKVEAVVRERSALLPFHYRIQQVRVVKELPKTSLGKVKRYELKKLGFAANATHEATVASKSDAFSGLSPSEKKLIEKIAAFCEDSSKIMHLSLGELGLDSLGLAEVEQLIEAEFQLTFNNVQLLKFANTRELLAAIAKKSGVEVQQSGQKAAKKSRAAYSGMQHQTVFNAVSVAMSAIWKLEAEGLENLPQTGNYILFANHESHLDPLWIAGYLPTAIRGKLSTLGKKEHWENPFTAYFADMLGGIPVDREGDVMQAMAAAHETLKAGNCLLLFPEGTRSRSGTMGSFKRGVAKLALETKIPLVPVAIEGGFEIFPSHRNLPSLFDWSTFERRRLTVRFGRPIQVDKRPDSLQNEQELLAELEDAVLQLLDTGKE